MLAFDRPGLVKANQLRGDATGFRVFVAFTVWRFCLLNARMWPARVISAAVSLGTDQDAHGGQPGAASGRFARSFATACGFGAGDVSMPTPGGVAWRARSARDLVRKEGSLELRFKGDYRQWEHLLRVDD